MGVHGFPQVVEQIWSLKIGHQENQEIHMIVPIFWATVELGMERMDCGMILIVTGSIISFVNLYN